MYIHLLSSLSPSQSGTSESPSVVLLMAHAWLTDNRLQTEVLIVAAQNGTFLMHGLWEHVIEDHK